MDVYNFLFSGYTYQDLYAYASRIGCATARYEIAEAFSKDYPWHDRETQILIRRMSEYQIDKLITFFIKYSRRHKENELTEEEYAEFIRTV